MERYVQGLDGETQSKIITSKIFAQMGEYCTNGYVRQRMAVWGLDWSASGQGEGLAGNFYIYRAPHNAVNLMTICGKIGFQDEISCMKLFGKLYWNYDKVQQYDGQSSPYIPACGSFIANFPSGTFLSVQENESRWPDYIFSRGCSVISHSDIE